ncbi:SDR family NAD(P)-dependent oxidoreductase [Corynebacterium sp. H78]|uniref:SDR family NAD(P)-dependent oxidoreductase n=1 Tax=Corynebacterium sp. H78 TaxID=3133417 RepID=UPI0030A6ACAE
MLDPTELAICLKVLEQGGQLPVDDPDSITLQRAVGRLFKEVKRSRRKEARRARIEADRAVISATATGSPARIDDETLGLDITRAKAAIDSGHGNEYGTPNLQSRDLPADGGQEFDPAKHAGRLVRSQNCYICKRPFTLVDKFHHQLCPDCVNENNMWRDARCDLRGRRALLTGGRAKIGMHIALRLLRDGAHLTITTRFPKDAVRRFAAHDDSPEWLHRLKVIGVDLRDPAQVIRLADTVAADGPLDILINNAAQTVKRSAGAYSGLVDAESAPLAPELEEAMSDGTGAQWISLGATMQLHPNQLVASVNNDEKAANAADALVAAALTGGSASLERVAQGTAVDAGGLIPDLVAHNSWVATVGNVDPVELLEVQLCNSVAPFILVNRLRPAMEASTFANKYIVNVSAMEGVFGRGYKGPGHPHTNMAKAALNMLTRTSAGELKEHGIFATAVDTGWITDERPHVTKQRLAQEGFHAPLDLIDGAARVYHPIVAGERGTLYAGVFLKDYQPSSW